MPSTPQQVESEDLLPSKTVSFSSDTTGGVYNFYRHQQFRERARQARRATRNHGSPTSEPDELVVTETIQIIHPAVVSGTISLSQHPAALQRDKTEAKRRRRKACRNERRASEAADDNLISAAIAADTALLTTPAASTVSNEAVVANMGEPPPILIQADPNVQTLLPSPPVPFQAAARFRCVQDWLGSLLQNTSFSTSRLRHEQRKIISPAAVAETRPHAMDVRAMFKPHMFACGTEPLPVGESALKVEGFDQHHLGHCDLCRNNGSIHPDCYWFLLRQCVTNGFAGALKPDSTGTPTRLYEGQGIKGNHASFDQYPKFTAQQFDRLKQRHKVSPATSSAWFNPQGVNIPRSRWNQALALTGIKVVDDESYAAAADKLAAMFVSILKRRMIFDQTGAGVNDMFQIENFRYISIDDILRHVKPDCHMSVCDIEAYYHNFSLATAIRWLFGCSTVEDGDMVFNVFPFGWSQAPYLASTMTAELVADIRALDADVEAMIDDFFTCGSDAENCMLNEQKVHRVLTDCGFTLAEGKTQRGQQVTVIGYQIDSVTMTVTVPPSSAKSFQLCLERHADKLRRGEHISHNTWRHVCGKLNDYAKVAQEGRSRVSFCWTYLTHGTEMSPHGMRLLLADLDWWIDKLATWARGNATGCEYPIVTRATLLDNPNSIDILISDASGDDGYGGFAGNLHDDNPLVFSHQWPGDKPKSSYVGELAALQYYLESKLPTSDSTDCSQQYKPLLLLWVSDNQGAALSINSGRAHEADGRVLLHEIFELAGKLKVTLVALWQPREYNHFADFLSHLAFNLNTPSFQGHASDFSSSASPGSRVESGPEEVCKDSGLQIPALPVVLLHAERPDGTSAVRISSRLPGHVPTPESWPHSFLIGSTVESPYAVPQAQHAVPERQRRGSRHRTDRGAPSGRHYPSPSYESPPIQAPVEVSRTAGSVQHSSPPRGCFTDVRAERAVTDSRGNQWTPSRRLPLVRRQPDSRSPPQTHQDSPTRSRGPYRSQSVEAPIVRSSPTSPLMGHPGPRLPPERVRFLQDQPACQQNHGQSPRPDKPSFSQCIPLPYQTIRQQYRPRSYQVLGPLASVGRSH